MKELKKLMAFLFQRGGKERLNEKDIYNMLSFQLGWMSPKEGRKAIEMAIEKNIVRKENDEIIPNFDYKEIEIPLGFKFDGEMLEKISKDLLSRIIDKILENSDFGEKRIREEIRKLSDSMDIYPEIAALLLAKKIDIDIEEFIKEAREFIKMK